MHKNDHVVRFTSLPDGYADEMPMLTSESVKQTMAGDFESEKNLVPLVH